MKHPAEIEIDILIMEHIASRDRLIAHGPQRAPGWDSGAPLAPGDEAVSGRYPVGMQGGVR